MKHLKSFENKTSEKPEKKVKNSLSYLLRFTKDKLEANDTEEMDDISEESSLNPPHFSPKSAKLQKD